MLGLDKYPEDEAVTEMLEKANIFFSAFFFAEMILKLVGLGFKGFV